MSAQGGLTRLSRSGDDRAIARPGLGKISRARRSDGSPKSKNAERRGMIRVLIVENTNLVRGGLVALLDAQPDMSVGAALESADKAVPTALEMDADVAL